MMSEWYKIVEKSAEILPKAHILTYFQKTALLRVEKNTLVVGIPREFFRGWLESNAKDAILSASQQFFPNSENVLFEVDGTLEQQSDFDPRNIFSGTFRKSSPVKKQEPFTISRIQMGLARRFLNPSLTFENFIVGSGSALAHAAAEAVANAPGQKYSPLFLFGGVGLGKTHLMHAIGNRIAEETPDANILLLQTQNFVDEVVNAVRSGKGDQIRDKYRRADVFMLDDVQFIRGKERTQEILFHIFNDLNLHNRQIVLSSDCAPSLLEGLEERLVSRFSMGMVADIQFPDFETRLAILQERCQESDLSFSRDVLEYVAEECSGSVRELLGVFRQMLANFELQGVLPNKTNVGEIFKNMNREKRQEMDIKEEVASGKAMSIEEIAERTALFFDVPLEKLIGSSRLREYVVPRQTAMWFANKKLKEPLQKIGNYFGGRDHTSVLSAVRRTEKNRKLSSDYWRQCNDLRKKLGM
ncbi:chromosomal replication initiator protein DnaA [Candidatus Peregrinibacteria bacterium]|nr:MAG: chromosomal replication initiator protein DnaA [Candidatus Peregrinibacteria bacterium]